MGKKTKSVKKEIIKKQKNPEKKPKDEKEGSAAMTPEVKESKTQPAAKTTATPVVKVDSKANSLAQQQKKIEMQMKQAKEKSSETERKKNWKKKQQKATKKKPKKGT